MQTPAAPSPANQPGRNHDRPLHQRLLAALSEWYGPRATVRGHAKLQLAGQSLVVAVAVFKSPAGPDVPLLTVLVLDATAPFGPQVAAARQLVAAGVPSCWLVEPTLRTVTITAEAGRYQSFNQHETLRDPATGIELELAQLFG